MSSIEVVTDLIALPAMRPGSNQVDWDDVTVTAIALGLAPLLYWRLEQRRVELPPLALAKLSVTHQAHAKRNSDIARQLAELLAAFERQQIEVLVLKGALLAATVYPDPALRPMNDIDLLFRPEDLPRVRPVLEGLGYWGKHKSADQGPGISKHLSTYRRQGQRGSTPNPYLSPAADRMVEPHGSLAESWFGLNVDITPGVWERAVPIRLYDQPAFRLGTTDMLLHLAVHAAFHVIMGAPVFVQLYDIGRVIEAWIEEVDWAQLVQLARQAKAQPFVYAGLYWAQSLYRIRMPEPPLAQLRANCQPNLTDYIQNFDARRLIARTQQPPLNTLQQRLQRGLSDRREAARWAGSLGAKWQIWQTALAFYKTDTMALVKQKFVSH
ncbi:MAG TPA: nucleotidyltransferase family protein [Anaerolineae bacterium]|nr:nucleotidyltransferase family protein [Anaerolineae bacterium]HMR63764.1 nucleotidyltransferase family protein [Anaerolineae bacterium]